MYKTFEGKTNTCIQKIRAKYVSDMCIYCIEDEIKRTLLERMRYIGGNLLEEFVKE